MREELPPLRMSRGGCLFRILWALAWVVVVLAPLPFADDVIGPAVGARWVLGPADGLRVSVPPGSHLVVSGTAVRQADVVTGRVPATVGLSVQEAGGPPIPLPPRELPVVGGYGNGHRPAPDLRPVRLWSLTTTTGHVTLRGDSRRPLDVRRDDPGVQRNYRVLVIGTRLAWPVLAWLLMWGPVVLVGRSRSMASSGSR